MNHGDSMRYVMDERHISPILALDSLRPKIVAPPPSYRPNEKAANFILVKLTPGSVPQIKKELRKISGVNGIHSVYGEYDLVIIARENSEEERQNLLRSIRAVSGVLDVQTLLAAS
jgi:DNA-binding Lrp family transcriptional regulator